METGLDKRYFTAIAEQRRMHKMLRISFIIMLILFCFSIFFRTTKLGLIPFKAEITNLWNLARLSWADIFNLPLSNERGSIINASPYFDETVGRLKSVFVTLVAGAALSLGGAVYQSVFRNPIAAPSMLGVSAGVNISMVIMVILYSQEAISMVIAQQFYCYGTCFAILILIILYGRFLGGKKFSVVNMLLAGSILTRIITELVSLVQEKLSETDVETLQDLVTNGFGFYGVTSVIIFVVTLIIGIFPLHLMRFSMNAVSFSEDDSHTIGVNTFKMRMIALLCATVLVTSATMHCGNIAMLSLMAPHICRYIYGPDFKKQYYSCMMFGASFLLLCRIIATCFSFGSLAGIISMGTVVNVVAVPIFVIVLISGRRGWL